MATKADSLGHAKDPNLIVVMDPYKIGGQSGLKMATEGAFLQQGLDRDDWDIQDLPDRKKALELFQCLGEESGRQAAETRKRIVFVLLGDSREGGSLENAPEEVLDLARAARESTDSSRIFIMANVAGDILREAQSRGDIRLLLKGSIESVHLAVSESYRDVITKDPKEALATLVDSTDSRGDFLRKCLMESMAEKHGEYEETVAWLKETLSEPSSSEAQRENVGGDEQIAIALAALQKGVNDLNQIQDRFQVLEKNIQVTREKTDTGFWYPLKHLWGTLKGLFERQSSRSKKK